MTIPVYVFTGFLESGKSTLIKDTLKDPGFGSEEKTLLIVCEEGIEEYETNFLRKTNTTMVQVRTQEELTYAFLKQCDANMEPDRVMIEFNGTWNFTDFIQTEYPFDWLLVQVVSCVNADTFEMYIANMRSMIYDQLLHSEAIIFNRCDETTDIQYLRNNIKAINKSAQLIYESKNGEILELKDIELPFDLQADTIVINDDDYGIWYMDALEHPEKYEGKTVQLQGSVIATHVEGIKNAFVFGRYAMVCCADDTSLIGLLCHYQNASSLIPKDWVRIRAQVEIEYDEGYQGNVPILYVKELDVTDVLEDNLVYFS